MTLPNHTVHTITSTHTHTHTHIYKYYLGPFKRNTNIAGHLISAYLNLVSSVRDQSHTSWYSPLAILICSIMNLVAVRSVLFLVD